MDPRAREVAGRPRPLAAVVVGSLAANVLALPIAFVTVPDNLLASVTFVSVDTLRLLADPTILGAALAMAVIASAETLLCATAVDRMLVGHRTDYNRELFAQGVGNTLCGLVGGLPMTGVIVRSTANVQAGAVTRWSAFLHGGWILLLVVLLPGVLQSIRVASLAAILVYTGYKLLNPASVARLAKFGRGEVVTWGVTVVAIVSTDLLRGVLIGFGLAVVRLLFRMSRLDVEFEDDPAQRRAVLHLRGAATFLRLADIAEALEGVPADRELHIRFDEMEHLDHAVLELLIAWESQHRLRGGVVIVDWDALERRYHEPRASRDPGGAAPRFAGEGARPAA